MPAPVYATAADYLAYCNGVITDTLLKQASLRVDELIIGAVYETDSNDQPTDPDIIDALREATCAMAQWMNEQGDTTGTGGSSSGTLKSASIGSASWSYGDSPTTGRQLTTSSGLLVAPVAVSVLRVAGLLPAAPIVVG